MKGAQAIVKSLIEEKVEHVFGIQGGSIMEVYDVFYDTKELRHILMRHEQCAAHAAEGYARAKGSPGVCIATSGPGATNLVTGLADAFLDSIPVIAFTGNVPTHLIGNDAFQEADIVGITMPITKHNFQITDVDRIPETIKSAFHIATTRRQGPVLIDLPKDIQQNRLTKKFSYPKEACLAGYKDVKSGGHSNQLKAAGKMLVEAERPVLLAGGGVITAQASIELVKLAESLNIPVTTTLMAKGVIPEEHPLAAGMLGMHGRKAANLLVTECDVLFAVGCRFSDRITGNVKYFAPDARIIHCDVDACEIGKNVDVDIPIVGDAKLVLQNILKTVAKLKSKKRGVWNEKVKKYFKEYAPFYDFDDKPIQPQRVMKEINKLIDDKTIITTEVGQCQMWAAHYLNIKHPRTFISSGGLGTMGFGFPASLGAKVAKPDHKVLDVGSDGSFIMTGQDLATSVTEDIPVTVVILNNHYLGMVKQWQDLFYEKRRSHTYLGHSPDFIKFADAFGAKGIKVEKPGDIAPALKRAIKSSVATVVDIEVDPDAYVLPMVPPGGQLNKMIEKLD